jgi:hypothetical protein
MIDRYRSVVRGMQSALRLWEEVEAFDTTPMPMSILAVIQMLVVEVEVDHRL